ncbi:hypothetical protein ACHAXR_000362 [Thalassiosira sp. AJA248-18]
MQKATADGHVYVEIRRGMYGLPQAGLIAQELLEKRLNKEGYFQSEIVPGLWTHKWRPIQFTLVVVDFGVKYAGEEHAQHFSEDVRRALWHHDRLEGRKIHWTYAGLGL